MSGYFHLRVRAIPKGKGRRRALYILRLESYRVREDLEERGHGNLPAWCGGDAIEFFAAADQHERKNGTVAKEITVAVPRDLPRDAQRELIQLLIAHIAGTSHAYCYGFHKVRSSDGGTNPHAHKMWSERIDDRHPRGRNQYFARAYPRKRNGGEGSINDGRGGCRKSRRFALFARAKSGFAASPELLKLRRWWADQCNAALRRHGIEKDVSERSYQARQIPLTPGVHVYDSGRQIEARGGVSHRAEANRAAMAANRAIALNSAGMRDQADAHRGVPPATGRRILRPTPYDAFAYELEVELLPDADDGLNTSLVRSLVQHIEATSNDRCEFIELIGIREALPPRVRMTWKEGTSRPNPMRAERLQQWWLSQREAAAIAVSVEVGQASGPEARDAVGRTRRRPT